MKTKFLGIFSGIPIEMLLESRKDHGELLLEKDIQRILSKGMKKWKKEQPDNFMLKDFKTKTKVVISLREESFKIKGYIEMIYPINYFPYKEPDENKFFSSKDSYKIINKKLKQKSAEGYFFYYSYKETTFCSDFFEDGELYHTYKIIDLIEGK